MDQDKIKLWVTNAAGGRVEIEEFISYSLDSDLFQAADAFEIVIGGSGAFIDIKRGDRIKVFVNDQLELTAIANKPQRSYTKSDGSKLTIKGVDMMGLLTQHYIETGRTFENVSTEDMVEELVADVPFINESDFTIHAGAKNDPKPQTVTSKFALRAKSTKGIFKTRAGETVFSALMRFALSKGVLFYNLPDGTFALGGLITTGRPSFWLTPTNILSMNEKEDPGQAFSKVVIFAQQQNIEAASPGTPLVLGDVFKKAEVTDPDFPYFKPFVARSNQGGSEEDLQKQAALKMAEFKYAEVGLTYVTFGHSQAQGIGRRNWQTNMVAGVINNPEFKVSDLDGDYLSVGRRFQMNKKQGTTTEVRLAQLRYSPTV